MNPDEENARQIEQQSRQIVSSIMYRRVKSVVDSWDREERGKLKVAAGAILGFAVWVAAIYLAGRVFGGAVAAPVMLIGVVVYLCFIFVLIRKYLGRF